jgi:hypothetical protein|tara:strand:- start:2177 stop:3259 length:1083 start_codon:yes stop_codon:yes gene_type:complete
MKILLISPIAIPTDPLLKYGGIERVVLALDRSFQEQGYDVFVAAPADSNPYGNLVPTITESQGVGDHPKAYEKHIELSLQFALQENIDIIHDHTGNLPLSKTFKRKLKSIQELREIPIVSTPHEWQRFKRYGLPKDRSNIFFTTLSECQRARFEGFIPITKVINNGVSVEEYPFNPEKEDYLFSIGSIESDKGQDLAVKVSEKTGIPIRLAGNIADQEFFNTMIAPSIKRGTTIYLGELDDTEKKSQYANACALIAPIIIPDCFSLVRIEALATGTPVITLDTGSAREAIKHGDTGYLANYDLGNEASAISTMAMHTKQISEINPHNCRKDAEERFSWRKISGQYLDLYERIISGRITSK